MASPRLTCLPHPGGSCSVRFLVKSSVAALLEGLIAEGASGGRTDLSLVSVDSTTVRAHHAAAGMRVSKHLMDALEEAAQEQATARQKGADRRNRTDRPSASASDTDAGSA